METVAFGMSHQRRRYYRWAYTLALITIFYNILEGVISVLFGLEDETVALFGFGIDSFVEVISGIGIWHMVRRLRDDSTGNPDRFEQQALRITGTAFYILAAGLAVTAVISYFAGHAPETTFWGIVVSSVSILMMWLLIHYKTSIGEKLSSDAILADARCTRVCLYLSVVLLLSSAGYELTGIGMIDSIGAMGISVFSFKEGREAFEKARGKSCSCGDSCH